MAALSYTPVVRFAPSPNGYLHLGHAYSALLNYDFARRHNGRFLLRIEDIDELRSKPAFIDAIYEDLAWLGIAWEEPVRRQSEHREIYAASLAQLAGLDVLYPCVCSRGDIRRAIARKRHGNDTWPCDPDGSPIYPLTCRKLGNPGNLELVNRSCALRMNMNRALDIAGTPLTWREFGAADSPSNVIAAPEKWGDIVVARKDIANSYHLAVVTDDAIQGVTDVIRGDDLYAATSAHRVLQQLLELPAPNYRHHHLIMDEQNTKLAKSARSKTLRALRAEGCSPEEIYRRLGLH